MVKTIISVIAASLAVALFFGYTQPEYDGLRNVQAQVADYDAALQRASELQQLKQTLLSRYNAFNPAEVERLSKLLPDHVDNVRLVLDLDSLAARHGLTLQNVDVAESAPAAPVGSASASASVGENARKYDSLTLRFATQGTYANFVAFLRELEASLRIVDLVSLKLDRISAAGPQASVPVYRYELTMRTFWLK